MKKLNYITALLFSILLFSCVPQRKLEEEQARRNSCEKELSALKDSFQLCDTRLTEATKKLSDYLREVTGLERDTSIIGTSLRNLTSKYDKLNSVNDQLLEKYNRLLEGNLADTRKLSGELQLTQEQLLKKQDELKQLEAELKKRESRVAELEGVLRKKDEAVNELKRKMSDALLGFEGKGLSITQKNGKVYVSMDESLLFASGSITVEGKGTEALKNFLVESELLGFLPKRSVLKELADKTLTEINFEGLNIERNFYFIQRKGESSELTKAFIKIAKTSHNLHNLKL